MDTLNNVVRAIFNSKENKEIPNLDILGGGNDWPVVPIFGRRKRARQAIYAEPSQDLKYNSNQENKQFGQNKRSSVGFGKSGSDVSFDENIVLDDLENDDLFGLDTGASIKGSSANRFDDGALQRSARQHNMNETMLIQNQSQTHEQPKQKLGCEATRVISLASKKYPHFRPIGAGLGTLLARQSSIAFHTNLMERTGNQESLTNNTTSNRESSGSNASESGAQEKKPRKKQEPSLQDKSTVPRMLTIDIKSVKEINVKKKDIFALYEIYGILESAVICLPGQAAKRFTIKDNSGSLRCIFWEIDRPFPQLRRGTSVRCIGRFSNNGFQCLKIRPSAQSEISYCQVLQMQSKDALQKCLDTDVEYSAGLVT